MYHDHYIQLKEAQEQFWQNLLPPEPNHLCDFDKTKYLQNQATFVCACVCVLCMHTCAKG